MGQLVYTEAGKDYCFHKWGRGAWVHNQQIKRTIKRARSKHERSHPERSWIMAFSWSPNQCTVPNMSIFFFSKSTYQKGFTVKIRGIWSIFCKTGQPLQLQIAARSYTYKFLVSVPKIERRFDKFHQMNVSYDHPFILSSFQLQLAT